MAPALIFYSPYVILPAMNELRAICARLLGNELVAAECANLCGGIPDAEGVAVCQDLDLLPRSAYLSLGLRCLAQADTLENLVAQVQALHLAPHGFRIEFLDLTAQGKISKRAAILSLSDALDALPDLDHPRQRFLCVVQASCLWLGELLNENERSYKRHDAKPCRTSSSLSSRLSRALVNLVAPPARTLLDPFCGTGSTLLEAACVGLEATGVDSNPRMVGMSRRNLAHYGYAATVETGDALTTAMTADAIVTDLPYGRLLQVDHAAFERAFEHLVTLAPRAVYLAGDDLSATLQKAGYSVVHVLRVRKHHTMSRFVHLCQV
jgi:predicted RNA methylase